MSGPFFKIKPADVNEAGEIKLLAEERAMTVRPEFYGQAGIESNPVRIETFDHKSRRLRIYLLRFSGKIGRVQLIDCTKPVKSFMERHGSPIDREEAEAEKAKVEAEKVAADAKLGKGGK